MMMGVSAGQCRLRGKVPQMRDLAYAAGWDRVGFIEEGLKPMNASRQVVMTYEKVSDVLTGVSGVDGAYQLLVILLGFMVSYLLAQAVAGPLKKQVDKLPETWLRVSRPVLRVRLLPMFMLLVLGCELAIFSEATTTPPLLLGIVVKLTAAWIGIALLASVIKNRFMFRVVCVSVWLVVALSILGWLPAVAAGLDQMALTVGTARISVLRILKVLVLAVVLGWGIGLVSRLADRGLNAQELSPSMKVLLGKIVRILLVVAAFVVAMVMVGIDLTAFAVLSGALGVGLGFGLQKTVSNFISGIWLLLDKSIKPGDVISMGETFGWISQINTRYTSVVTRDGREHLIPNEQLITQEVINWSYTDDKVRLDVPFGVSHKADPHQVRKVVKEAIANLPRVLSKPVAVVHFVKFGESSLEFVARFWIRDPVEGLMNVKSEVLFAIWDVLKKNEIAIPYAQRDVHFPEGVRIVREKD